MIAVLAIDALEYNKVGEYDCKNLKQEYYGKTDISEFSQPRTMVLWSSFMTGQNKEKEVLLEGDKEMWNKKWDIKDTFFSKFKNPCVLDLPGFSYDIKVHEKSRKLLKAFFEAEDDNKQEEIRKEYNQDAFNHHEKIKKEFFKALKLQKNDFVLGYFSLADVIGHLNFGNNTMMKMIYQEFDEIAAEIRNMLDIKLLVLSDHGMKAIGIFGDHSEYGFWSSNINLGIKDPKITDIGRYL
jgi:hypothetical protein